MRRRPSPPPPPSPLAPLLHTTSTHTPFLHSLFCSLSFFLLLLLPSPTNASLRGSSSNAPAPITNTSNLLASFEIATDQDRQTHTQSLAAATTTLLQEFVFSAASGDAEALDAHFRQLHDIDITSMTSTPQVSSRFDGDFETYFPLVAILRDPRGVHDRSPSKHWLFPGCGFAQPIADAPLMCPGERLTETIADLNYNYNRREFATVSTMYNTERQPAQGAVPLPQRLRDVGHPMPFLIEDPKLIEAERHTYYWYYRVVLNMYYYVKRCVEADQENVDPPPLVPNGYHSPQLFYTRDELADLNPPFGMTYIKEDHMVFVMRGTIFNASFLQVATFGYANEAETKAVGLKGRINRGTFQQTMGLVEDLECELDRHPEVKRLTLTGHSLGAGHAQLLGVILALRRPELEVEAVNFGALSVGDCDFADQFGDIENLRGRWLIYLGNGLKTGGDTPFGIGDVVPQSLAACWWLKGCAGTLHPDTEEPVRYQATPGIVAFYAEEMPNTADWHRAEQVVTRESSISACHGCSYLCWSSQGLDDPEDRCYFNDKHEYPCPYVELSASVS